MADTQGLRFHWSLSAVGDPTRRGQAQAVMSGAFDLDTHVAFCREAERCGIDSLPMAFGFTRPDPFTWSAALGSRTEKINFLTAEVLARVRERERTTASTPARLS